MRKRSCFFHVFLIAVALFFAVGGSVSAQSEPAQSESVQVTDDAGLLSPSEKQDILKLVENLELSANWDVMVVSISDAGGRSGEEYAEQWFDENTTKDDGVICLIDMDNRELVIRTFGQAIYYLTDDRIDKILDAAYDGASREDYCGAYTKMLEGIQSAYQRGVPDNQYTYDENTGKIVGYYREKKKITPLEAVLAVVAALAAGGIAAGAVIGKYRMKWGGYQYSCRENSNVELVKKNDLFVNQMVTHRRIPRQNGSSHGSSGSRSTTHVGAGGRRSGGGSRKF